MQMPIDTDEDFLKLLEAFSLGQKFSVHAAGLVLNKPPHVMRKFLEELKEALAHCPEGAQLRSARGAFGGHWFEVP